MIDLKTEYAGLTLRNPIIISSSGLTLSPERNKEYEKAGAGAIVLKSLFEEQIEMQSDQLSQHSDYPEAEDYIRTYARMNQVNNYLDIIKKSKEPSQIPALISAMLRLPTVVAAIVLAGCIAKSDALNVVLF